MLDFRIAQFEDVCQPRCCKDHGRCSYDEKSCPIWKNLPKANPLIEAGTLLPNPKVHDLLKEIGVL